MWALLDFNVHSFLLFCSLTLLFLAKKPEEQKLMKYCCISTMISFVAIAIIVVSMIRLLPPTKLLIFHAS